MLQKRPGLESTTSAQVSTHDLDATEMAAAGLERLKCARLLGLRTSEKAMALDRRYLKDFRAVVRKVPFESVAVPMWRKDLTRIDLSRFGLVAIIGPEDVVSSSEVSGGYLNTVPRNVRCTYPGAGHGRPFLDASRGIGMTVREGRKRRLVTAASAFVDSIGSLAVLQIQNVSGVRPDDPEFAELGLRSGFDWRATLVTAYEAVARDIGARGVTVVSHVHSNYGHVTANGAPGYDDVAARMGYAQLPNSNWYRQVQA